MLRNRLRNLSGEVMRLPRPDKSSGLAMTKSIVPDELSDSLPREEGEL
jgi:hypothetical protein